MLDDADTAENSEATSKTSRLKNALVRTKTKFRRDREPAEFKLSDDVNEFLAAGRTSDSTSRSRSPSVGRNNEPQNDFPIPQPLQQSPRKPSVPKLDISQSSRWPDARPIDENIHSRERHAAAERNELLQPAGWRDQRSQSASSFKKKRRKPKNVQVNFDQRPPVVIGEGGDEATAPSIEISKLKERIRARYPAMPAQAELRPGLPPRYRSEGQAQPQSVPADLRPEMPMRHRSESQASGSSQGSGSSVTRKPLPAAAGRNGLPPYANHPSNSDLALVPQPLQILQTGSLPVKNPLKDEFEQSLSSASAADSAEGDNHFRTELIQPRPVRLVQPPQVDTAASLPDAPQEVAISDTAEEVPLPKLRARPIRIRTPPPLVLGQQLPVEIEAAVNVGKSETKVQHIAPVEASKQHRRPPVQPSPTEVALTQLQSANRFYAAAATGAPIKQAQVQVKSVPVREDGVVAVPLRRPGHIEPSSQPYQTAALMPHMGHRKKPSRDETETMSKGAGGWL